MLIYNGLTDLEIKGIYKYIMSLTPICDNVDRKWDQD